MHAIALLDTLSGWWLELTVAKQIFYGIGALAAAGALIQAILTMIGLDHHDSLDGLDALHGGGVIALKPLTGFFLAFGWGGGIALGYGLSVPVATVVATVSGAAVLALVVSMMHAIYSMRADGTIKIEHAVGKVATVYVSLPPSRASGGQIIISIDGREETLQALNSTDRPVPSGEKVRVTEVVDGRTLLVEPLA